MNAPRRNRPLLLAWTLLASMCGGVAFAGTGPSLGSVRLAGAGLAGVPGKAESVAELLAQSVETMPQAEALAAELAKQGPKAIPESLAGLAGGELGVLKESAVLEAFSKLSPTAVRLHLAALDRAAADDAMRRATLLVYGVIGNGDDLRAMVTAAAPLDLGTPIGLVVRGAFGDALGQVLARDSGALRHLESAFNIAHPSLKAQLVTGVRDAGRVEGMAVLNKLLGHEPELDPIVLAAIGDLAGGAYEQLDAGLLRSVRSYLSERDERLVQAAVLALAELEDPRSVDELIRLLGSANTNLCQSANKALIRIAARDFHGDRQRWRDWYEDEQAWWLEAEERILSDFRSGMNARVARSLNEVSSHRLFRRELELTLVESLETRDPPLVAMACGALGSLGSRAAVAELKALTDHRDERVASAARQACLRILGRSEFGTARASIEAEAPQN